jgi:two-component system response regulator HydG
MDPRKAVEQGKLREDLFYRLNVVLLDVPALRDRPEDIPLLTEHFLARFAAKHKKMIREVSPEALDVLTAFDWPGNVRELENTVERAVVLNQGPSIGPSDLPPPLNRAPEPQIPEPSQTFNLREVERATILRALTSTGWNKSLAAKKLGIFASSLYKKMKRLGIPIRRPS